MITAAPLPIPVTKPVLSIIAIVESLVAQLPPEMESTKIELVPVQIVVFPVITDGFGYIVIGKVVLQPVPKVYWIFVDPGAKPVTTPESEILAIAASATDQVPPPSVSTNVVIWPKQKALDPIIALGDAFRVTAIVE